MDPHKTWELLMAAKQCIVQAIDENERLTDEIGRLTEELGHNRKRMLTALARLDTASGADEARAIPVIHCAVDSTEVNPGGGVG